MEFTVTDGVICLLLGTVITWAFSIQKQSNAHQSKLSVVEVELEHSKESRETKDALQKIIIDELRQINDKISNLRAEVMVLYDRQEQSNHK